MADLIRAPKMPSNPYINGFGAGNFDLSIGGRAVARLAGQQWAELQDKLKELDKKRRELQQLEEAVRHRERELAELDTILQREAEADR